LCLICLLGTVLPVCLRISGLFLSPLLFCYDSATTSGYSLSLHDALPISAADKGKDTRDYLAEPLFRSLPLIKERILVIILLLQRSEERFSRNAETDLVCRLLLGKKKRGDHHAAMRPDASRGVRRGGMLRR